jgi:catechol 2,3-dioxygenase-like lactoylglutathione lyase family enzyme
MVKNLAHICFTVRDLKTSLSFYCDILGLKQAFDFVNEKGERFGVYLHAGGRNFIELFQGEIDNRAAKQSFGHFCLEVDDIHSMVSHFQAHNIEVSKPITGSDNSLQAWLSDPDGNKIELHEYTQFSKQKKFLS